ncbi:LysR family transcriptional regulator [Maledivibacter halophilus]|uniref:DNA-binding transcriptional regulator, LysR family n=1 Tax=Maledivibacter halophilus TaxID=36842 RepID=A0A1T5MX47_9FIRM|nr:LysR family transcriptional regulator [Maledivibacter halophilus]SKC92573.1 DNA-binding transcriptional regulator, LysR family [Maledivibacter halophilus]
MDIKHLKCFVTVAEYLSFTKASEILHITQPTISKMVKTLEDELCKTLFHRSPKIELTDVGKVLFKQAKEILILFDNIESELEDVIAIKKGIIKIGIPPIIGASFFPKIIGEFKRKYPYIDIQMVEVGSKKIERLVDEGTLDIGIVCTAPIQKDTLNMFPFVKSPLMLIVNPNHKLNKKEIVKYKDLKDESIVLYGKDFSLYDVITNRCIENNFYPKIVCESSQRDFIVEMVAEGIGVSFLDEKTYSKINTKSITALKLEAPSIYLHLFVIWKKNRYISFAAKEWLKFVSLKFNINLEI